MNFKEEEERGVTLKYICIPVLVNAPDWLYKRLCEGGDMEAEGRQVEKNDKGVMRRGDKKKSIF